MNILDYIVPKNPLKPTQQPAADTEFNPEKLGPKEVFMSWQAAGRPMQKFGSDKMTRSLAVIGVVIALFLVILQEYFLILVIASLIFVQQVLSKTPPENTGYEITSYGISADGVTYYWHKLRRFFFFNHDGHTGVAVDLTDGFPTRLFLTLDPARHAEAKAILEQHIQFLESEPESFLDRTYRSVTGKFNA